MQQHADVVTDLKGNVVPNAEVRVLLLDGSLATVYPANGGQAGSNPVMTDANGLFKFYAPNGRYKTEISIGNNTFAGDPDIVLFDPVEASFPTLAQLASPSGATLVNYGDRPVADKLAEIPSVLDAGAAGDGVVGDSAAIQAAINALAASGGGRLHVPAGAYKVNATITIPSKVVIVGDGIDATRFVAANGLNADMFTTTGTTALWAGNTAGGAKYWGITNCTIDGNRANNTTGHAVKTYSRTYLIDRVKIVGAAQVGLYSRWASNAASFDDDNYDPFMEAQISDLYVGTCGEEGIYYDGPHDGRMTNVVAGLNSYTVQGAKSGIRVGPRAGGLMAAQCHSWGDYQKYAWHIEAASTHFANCEADDAAVALVMVEADQFNWVGGNQIGGFIATPPSASDIALKGFVLGSASKTIYHPNISTSVHNCAGGMVDFTYCGTGSGRVVIHGSVSAQLQAATTTKGFVGSLPPSFEIEVWCAGAQSAFSTRQIPDVVAAVTGSAAFPAFTTMSNRQAGIFFPGTNLLGLSTNGIEHLRVNGLGVVTHRQDQTTVINVNSHIGLRSYQVSGLPTAGGDNTRTMVYVSDGSSNRRLAVSDGTNWRFPDGAIVS